MTASRLRLDVKSINEDVVWKETAKTCVNVVCLTGINLLSLFALVVYYCGIASYLVATYANIP